MLMTYLRDVQCAEIFWHTVDEDRAARFVLDELYKRHYNFIAYESDENAPQFSVVRLALKPLEYEPLRQLYSNILWLIPRDKKRR